MKHLMMLLAILVALECQSQTKNDMKSTTIEVVTFSVKAGISNEEASEKLSLLNEIVKGYDGFIKRTFSVNEEGQWIYIVHWTSKELALKAAEDVAKNQKAGAVFEIIDESSISMNHYEIINSFNN